MIVSPSMGLTVWNLSTDPFDSQQLADNTARIDQHDHSLGKGAPLGPGSIGPAQLAAQSVGLAAVAPDLATDYGYGTSVWRPSVFRGGVTTGGLTSPSPCYFLTSNASATVTSSLAIGTNAAIYLDPAVYTAGTRKLRATVSAALIVGGSTAPDPSYTVGLYSLTGPSAGGNWTPSLTLSQVTFPGGGPTTAPGAHALVSVTRRLITTPGWYALAFTTTGSENVVVTIYAQLLLSVSP